MRKAEERSRALLGGANRDLSIDGEERKTRERSPDEKEVDWSQIRYQNDEEQVYSPLERKDYLALFIAALQTIFLPLLILMIILITLSFVATFIG